LSLSGSRHDSAGSVQQRLGGGLARNGAASRVEWRRGRQRRGIEMEGEERSGSDFGDDSAPRCEGRAESRGEEEQELVGTKASSGSMGQGSSAGHVRLFIAALEAVRWGENLLTGKIFASNGGRDQRSTGWQGDPCTGSQQRGEGEAVGHSPTQ
jgi:hypothetical protein